MVLLGCEVDDMIKTRLWQFIVSVICGIVACPFIGTLASNIFVPYAKSDADISTVFEVSTIIAFPILSAIIFFLLQYFFKGRTKR
jgi:sorbitol-specific phosphotransferase system component IIBC